MPLRLTLAAGPLIAALAAASSALAQNPAPGQVPIEALPDAPGRTEVFYTCSACHSLQLVMQQRLSAARWDELISWMVTVNRMPEPAPEMRAVLVGYLAAAFPEPADRVYVNPFGP